MKITEIKYMRRFNLGNYEHEEIEATANLDEGESYIGALAELKNMVHGKHQEPVVPEPLIEEPVVVPEETAVEQTIVEEPKAEEIVEKKPKRATKKAAKVTNYDRGLDNHKKLLADVLDKNCPNWKKSGAKVKEISVLMEGKPFLNAEGSVIEDFIVEFKSKLEA